MNVKEFKIHVMRGIIKPEYFYIPVIIYEQEYDRVIIQLTDDSGMPFAAKRISISYSTFQLYHNFIRNDDGTYTYDQDSEPKGYAFETDYNWRYPVPNPSEYEILPLPNFRTNPPIINGAEIVSATNFSITLSFSSRNRIEIQNMPKGCGTISFYANSSYFDNYELINNIEYYPEYYNNYEHSVNRGGWQIDKNGKFSGFSQYNYSHPQYGYPNGYDFYCITEKFRNNTMPVIVKLKHRIRLVCMFVNIPNFTDKKFYYHYDTVQHEFGFFNIPASGVVQRYNEVYTGKKVPCYKIYVDEQYQGIVSEWFGFIFFEPGSDQKVVSWSYGDYRIEPEWGYYDNDNLRLLNNYDREYNYEGSEAANHGMSVYLDDHGFQRGRLDSTEYYPFKQTWIKAIGNLEIYSGKPRYYYTVTENRYGTQVESYQGTGDYRRTVYTIPVGEDEIYYEDTYSGYQTVNLPGKILPNSNVAIWKGDGSDVLAVGTPRYRVYLKDITAEEYDEIWEMINNSSNIITYEVEN